MFTPSFSRMEIEIVIWRDLFRKTMAGFISQENKKPFLQKDSCMITEYIS